MKIIDLTHTIHSSMPVFPGTEPPIIQEANTLEKDGFAEAKITFYSHTGTHMDAPAHMVEGGLSLDQYPIDHFIGDALVLNFTDIGSEEIGVEQLVPYEDRISKVDFVILKTGWSKYWGEDEYFIGFPALSEDAAKWLTNFKLKGIGIDAISIDSMKSTTFRVHQIFFQSNIVIIENIANLDSVINDNFIFSCMPLKTQKADGSPIRAVAIENNLQGY